MKPSLSLVVGASFLLVPAAGLAQTVEFRLIERTGKNVVSAGSDPTISVAVQARVVGGAPNQFIGNFAFDILAAGEADTRGTLSKLLISNADGTYAANAAQTQSNTVGRGGMASIYTYLAGISPSFNGLINTSGGPFTNTPGNQEISLITGSPTGQSLLLLTDTTGSGNPDTYSGTGTTAPIAQSIAETYLGANGNFVDLYRFKYTLADFESRQVTFSLVSVRAQVGTSLQLSNGSWGPVQANATVTAAGLTVGVIPAPAGATMVGMAALACVRRRRAAVA